MSTRRPKKSSVAGSTNSLPRGRPKRRPLDRLLALSKTERRKVLRGLSDAQARELLYDWSFWARPSQLPPRGKWRVWLLLTGRGFGKTRAGCEWVRSLAETDKTARIGLIAPTAADARDVIVEGESGLLAIAPPWARPLYEPSKRRLTWPSGAVATTYSADEPERLRGPQHTHLYCDEVAAWRYPETWDLAMMGLRLGADPRAVVTTTPKPTPLIRALVKSEHVAVTKGSTFENRDNLPQPFLEAIIARYQGTRLGRQELEAEILEHNPGALWTRELIEAARVTEGARGYGRIVVGVDPAISDGEGAAETGIVVVGREPAGDLYVLEDATIRGTPERWATAAVAAYHRHKADMIIAEANQGGQMVEATIKTVDGRVGVRQVHASRSKQARAEPVSALYEQGKVHHLGVFPELEDQLCEWVPGEGESPDRLDALVWAATDLMGTVAGIVDLSLNRSLVRESPWG